MRARKSRARQAEYEDDMQQVKEKLEGVTMSRAEKVELLIKEARRKGLNTQPRKNGRRTAFGERLSRL